MSHKLRNKIKLSSSLPRLFRYFRQHNVLELKTEQNPLALGDLLKLQAYVWLYMEKHEIYSVADVTVTAVVHHLTPAVIAALPALGYKSVHKGIFKCRHSAFGSYVISIGKEKVAAALSKEDHLAVLSKKDLVTALSKKDLIAALSEKDIIAALLRKRAHIKSTPGWFDARATSKAPGSKQPKRCLEAVKWKIEEQLKDKLFIKVAEKRIGGTNGDWQKCRDGGSIFSRSIA